ncbi:prolyl-tRNA synthetase [Candidatus Gracilibacteria bacterium]|nr:prolyl-tRNA synthetase [Candidatus Gracilibacteria bacterium]OIO77587.1 MAG: hypothetical protein AUJ87_00990 [Candidatus Gracilibacteria bacterium CG1_02_38_174]PIQ10503.1 MAG: prolyl-tRNA synthetase [Candidatus Gracilibacteria bacterium CG18_big_fil_WC_8_21_14_2_50_38_16]PIQ41720.1 MAG: prolyl-tRNA synthetase [Candidatus Gracilibacteria bacterium CG12_big_fil_rev_8_21_14_0_65_38_15]PIZ01753.1 MAG: prolyl-tRNA synthetase [Candidatus Gracilibacteria bacterium CG_4_10_14_0_8_um_filter_38_28]
MLQLSRYPFHTLKTVPQTSDNRSTGLLLQAGFVRQEMAGAYIYLHLGLRVLENIKRIVREELDAIGCSEILMTSFGTREHWETTGRWDTMDNLFKVEGASGKYYALNPTHEEIVTPLMQEFIQSYKNLDNCAVYQFQTKFRNEARAKSGILRGREFLMKDLYSFHRNSEDLDIFFEEVRKAYVRIYERLGLGESTRYVFASGGAFSKYSYEFQTDLGIGEDDVYVCSKCGQAHNEEIIDPTGFVCVECTSKEHFIVQASEVGNIFKLGTRFSNAFGLGYTDAEGKKQEVVMGCYGIGVSRLMGVIAEKFMDEKGLVWPENVAPFSYYMIVIGDHLEEAKKLAKKLESEGATVLIDDRNTGFGAKAGDTDLLGIPYRIVLSDKTLAQGGYEFKGRKESESRIVIL